MIGYSNETLSVASLHDCIWLCFTDLVRNLSSVTSQWNPIVWPFELKPPQWRVHMKLAISHVVLTIGLWTKLDDVAIKIEPL